MEAAAVGMVAVGVGAAAGTVGVVGMEVAVGTVAADGMDVAAGDVAGTVDIGGEAGVVGGPDTAGVVIPTTLTIPIILGVINPVRGGVFLTKITARHGRNQIVLPTSPTFLFWSLPRFLRHSAPTGL
ncbi:MAG TPA: hypothetical protein VN939_16055 [Chthoniobacterales bacterium]|nr:hypothetical protein [Chthoniobacterales bacterium]